MKKLTWISGLTLAMIAASGCASATPEKDVERRTADHPAEIRPGDVKEHALNTIRGDGSLSDEQKESLVGLVERVSTEQRALAGEIQKSRMALMHAVFDRKATEGEIRGLRRHLIRLEEKRLNLTLKAVDDSRVLFKGASAESQASVLNLLNGAYATERHL